MLKKFSRWIKSKNGLTTIAGFLAVLVVVAGAGQLLGWWDLGSLLGTAGPSMGGYSCLPTCVENDSKSLSQPGEDMASFGGTGIVVWIEAPIGSQSLELGIFDGDSSRGVDGIVSTRGRGHWDTTLTQSTYRLYADPARDSSGTTLVGEWLGNDTNPTSGSGWTASAATMPNNAWYNITINNVPTAFSSGKYHYRLEITRPAEGYGVNAFKLRSTGQMETGLGDIANANFAIISMMGSGRDAKIIYPQFVDYDNLGPTTTYTGTWEFYFDMPVGTKALTVWDGDFDYGAADGSSADTADHNTPTGAKPDWLTADMQAVANPEGAVGMGDPADDFVWPAANRPPSVQYILIAPDGTPLYVNNNPSGSQEWEQFIVANEEMRGKIEADLYSTSVIPGLYTLRIEGLDINNTVWFRVDSMVEPCVPCACEPTPTPVPPTPVPPTPTPPPCNAIDFCSLIRSPGYWKNWDNHYNEDQFQALIAQTAHFQGQSVAQITGLLNENNDQFQRHLVAAELNAAANPDFIGGIYNYGSLSGQSVAQLLDTAFNTTGPSADLDEAIRYLGAEGENAGSSCRLSCTGGGGGTTPPPGGGTQVCDNPRDYDVENTTNNPFYGIKFNYVSGGELKNGAEETLKVTLTSAQVASMASVQMEAKAGNNTGQLTLGSEDGCNFDQGTACGPKTNNNFAFSFVGTSDNGDGTKTLTFIVKNNTNKGLSHATIGLPNGAQAAWFCPQ